MSNLQNFLDYKQECPHCLNSLNFFFISKAHDKIRTIDDGIQVELEINSFPSSKNKKRFRTHYNLDYTTNEFSVDFIESGDTPTNVKYLQHIPKSRLDDCKSFTKNKMVVFYKSCGVCQRYNYSSGSIDFNYKTSKMEPFYVKREFINLSKKHGLDLRKYELTNDYADKKSTLLYNRFTNSTDLKSAMAASMSGKKDMKILEMPLIKMTEPTELMERLDTLIVFS